MRIIAFIEYEVGFKKILNHLGLWEISLVRVKRNRVASNHGPPDKSHPHIPEPTYDDDYSQIPAVDYGLQ